MELVHRYVELVKRKREIEAELRAVKTELGEGEGIGPGKMEKQALDWMVQNGMESARVPGMTVSVNRQLWAFAKDKDRESACEALRAAGLGDMVKENFNMLTLSAWVREQDEAGEPLPAAFAGRIEVAEVFRLGARRA